MKHSFILALLICMFIVLLLGLYLGLRSLSAVQSDVQDVKISLELAGVGKPLGRLVSEGASSTLPSSTPSLSESRDSALIQTAIIFSAQSSPLLQPQSNVAIIVEGVSKNADGEVTVSIKAFTSEATSYTALFPRDLFELVDLVSANQKPLKVIGSFDSIPPRSVTQGTLLFKVPLTAQTFILQVGAEDNPKYYEFNFGTRSYRETTLG
ncbi:hypothetical protein A3A21_01070 [Candidatus Jorgensenbacteria bacterium RIFCSPLOWO2_01_FULL_45_25b]|uniref:Uncharacterized protein n=1 Tax=Candidatus Jorgensenbacteria bacterium RIFCSPLOWO2_01_FULL_45_25b TaxID=1798471 RepID=A0A1F6BV32_9BACT|nr:MAG: hypothetical protein A3A21_01070 [Candidatus Jorgensenbacteria bacterium RIFCSPLOWO2_01_FULL_45_25b]